MRYIGSKISMLPTLTRIVQSRAPDAKTLCDPFAGTCTVSSHFKSLGFGISTGDALNASLAFQVGRVQINASPRFSELKDNRALKRFPERNRFASVIRYLNSLTPEQGYVSNNYSTVSSQRRVFFSKANAGKIDVIRDQIASWKSLSKLTDSEEKLLLMALLDAADSVANTAGTYYAHLKGLTRKAKNPLVLRIPKIVNNGTRNSCRLIDARKLVKQTEADVLYLDPPYNARDYSAYYHFPETLCLWDKPKIQGSAGLPVVRRQELSDFCKRATATKALEEILLNASVKYILVHYATDGLIPHKAILGTLSSVGRTKYRDYAVRAYGTSPDSENPTACHRVYWCDLRR